MATVADLGARVLRKLRFSLVPQASRAAAGAPSSSSDVAALAVRDLGIPVAEGSRPSALPPRTQSDVAAAALRHVGIGQSAGQGVGVVQQGEIAARALRMVGINPADLGSVMPDASTFVARTEIARRALLKLGVIGSDETPAATDLADAINSVVSIHDTLVVKDIATWPVDGIPLHAVERYVTMVANTIAPQYGRPASLDAYTAAEQMLRAEALTGYTAQNRALLKVAAVHAQLAADGVIDWSLSAIPAAAAEHYAVMAAQMLAPTYSQSADMQASAAAEVKIRRVALAGSLGLGIAMDKVANVHETLNSFGLVSWPLTAIPAGYAEHYAVLASMLIAAFSGLSQDPQTRQVNAAEWDVAVERVRRQTMIAGTLARAQRQVIAVHEEMNAAGLVSWDVEHIPASMADAYAGAVVAQLQGEIGKAVDVDAIESAYQRIRMLAMNGPAGQALAEQKIRAVHFSLDARGRVRWSLLNIPRYAEEPYVFMAAALLAPECGIKPDLASAEDAERELMDIVSLPSSGAPVQGEYF